MRHRNSGRKLGRNVVAPRRAVQQPRDLAAHLRAHRDHRGQGQGAAPLRRRDDHAGASRSHALVAKGDKATAGRARQDRPRAPHGAPDGQDARGARRACSARSARTSRRARAATRASSRRASARATRRRWRSSSSSASTASPTGVTAHASDGACMRASFATKFHDRCDARRMAGVRFSVYRRARLGVSNAASPGRRPCAITFFALVLARPRRLPSSSSEHHRRRRQRRRQRRHRRRDDDPGRAERRDAARHHGRRSTAWSSPRSTTYGAKTGDIWVEEPDGGAFSGIHVFGAPTAQVARARARRHRRHHRRGQGRVRARPTDTTGRTVTELEPADGRHDDRHQDRHRHACRRRGRRRARDRPDGRLHGALDAEWEKWEGVLITVSNVSALERAEVRRQRVHRPDAPELRHHRRRRSSSRASRRSRRRHVAQSPATASAASTGVVDYFFDYLILPRRRPRS